MGGETKAGDQALQQLRRRAEQQAAVARLSQRALALPEPQEIYDTTAQVCAAALDAQVAGLVEVIPGSTDLRLMSIVGMEVAHGSILPRENFPVPARTIESGEPVLVDDWQAPEYAALHSPLIRATGARTSASVPLVRSGQTVGALIAHRAEERPFDEQDVSFLLSMANVVAAFEERRALFARLQLTDRLAAVGTLASGVAHEMNNPLTYVLANLQFLDEELRLASETVLAPGGKPALGRAAEALREAREGAQRLSVIVRDLRTFSMGDSEHPTLVSLVPVVLSSVNVAQSELRSRARLELDVLPVPLVHGNAARLGQVCLNLLVNATQAIEPGHPERNQISVRTRTSARDEIALEVSDTGVGIAPANLKRIFDPFFTTKPPGLGTGLGLSICHGIVQKMGGRIEVESEPGRGSTFRVLLPRAPGTGLAPASAPGVLRRGKVLLVDDEPLVGMALRRALLSEHDVVLVQSARAALEELAQQAFDALISDIMMPEMTGLELHARVSRDFPALAGRTLFITGGALGDTMRELLARPDVLVLEKPIEVELLRKTVRQIVSQ